METERPVAQRSERQKSETRVRGTGMPGTQGSDRKRSDGFGKGEGQRDRDQRREWG